MKNKRKIRLFRFYVGMILFIISFPAGSKMIMEKLYDFEMINKYNIKELNVMYKGIPTEYKFGNSQINVFHVLSGESYIDLGTTLYT